MTRHHDESMALAALFDCWAPRWKAVNVHPNIRDDVSGALETFGFYFYETSPFLLSRLNGIGPAFDSTVQEAAILLTGAELRGPIFLALFRRFPPQKMILAAKSGLWWAVWDYGAAPYRTSLDISTAEYIPSKKRA